MAHTNSSNTKQAVLVPGDKPAIRFIKLPQVKDMTGISTTQVYRRMAAGDFPKQVMLGPKSAVWIEAEILAWCEARIAESRGQVA